jgi:hypothetical protein
MPNFKDKVRIENVRATRATDRALLCCIEGEDVWIPQSQIDDDSEVYQEDDEGTLIVSAWIAEEKGLG